LVKKTSDEKRVTPKMQGAKEKKKIFDAKRGTPKTQVDKKNK
jgi:hypothetical protein